mmetsp:Transcript_21326/g.29897  ORF Transcript_21326/g.29897 Transcript_21326/m.29897 type:complete len:239 (+) Transcript_21326:56-772(+)
MGIVSDFISFFCFALLAVDTAAFINSGTCRINSDLSMARGGDVANMCNRHPLLNDSLMGRHQDPYRIMNQADVAYDQTYNAPYMYNSGRYNSGRGGDMYNDNSYGRGGDMSNNRYYGRDMYNDRSYGRGMMNDDRSYGRDMYNDRSYGRDMYNDDRSYGRSMINDDRYYGRGMNYYGRQSSNRYYGYRNPREPVNSFGDALEAKPAGSFRYDAYGGRPYDSYGSNRSMTRNVYTALPM